MHGVKHDSATPTKAFVTWIHNFPEDLSSEELSDVTIVEAIPEMGPHESGKDQHLYMNPTNNELWYEYIDRALTELEEIQELKEANERFSQENQQLRQESADTTSALLDLFEMFQPPA